MDITLLSKAAIQNEEIEFQRILDHVKTRAPTLGFTNEDEVVRFINEAINASDHGLVPTAADKFQSKDGIRERREYLQRQREMMNLAIGQAHQESAIALEIVSMLMQALIPGHSSTTVSAHLQSTLPSRCIAAEKLSGSSPDAPDSGSHARECFAWRMEALQSSADKLLSAASRLQGEVEAETRYWRCIREVRKAGWPISRTSAQPHVLHVSYASSDSSPKYQQLGSATLRRNQGGSVTVERESSDRCNKFLRVQIMNRAQTTTYASSTRSIDRAPVSTPKQLEQEMLLARDSIFDQELLDILTSEASGLIEHEISTTKNSVTFAHGPGKSMVVDLSEPLTCAGDRSSHGASDSPINGAGIVRTVLRLLMCQAHAQIRERRKNPPPPLGAPQDEKSERPILGSFIKSLIHRAKHQVVLSTLDNYNLSLEKAGVNISYQTAEVQDDSIVRHDRRSPTQHITRSKLLSTLVSNLTRTRTSIRLCGLPIHTAIDLDQITEGSDRIYTTFKLTTNVSLEETEEDSISDGPIETLTDLKLELDRLLTKHLQIFIKANVPGWQNAEISSELLTIFDRDTKTRDSVKIEVSENLILAKRQINQTPHKVQKHLYQWSRASQGSTESLPQCLMR